MVEPISLSGRELSASASIGVVLGGPQYHTVDDVLRDADIAMYRAKAAGRGGYQLFDPMMHASAVRRLTLETELRQAIEREEFPCSTSRSSACRRRRSRASRRWPAGRVPTAARSRRPSSSRSPRRRG